MNLLPETHTIPLIITTSHYIGEQIFTLKEKYPNKKIAFVITACELALKMFGDWGNMVGLKGIGVKLNGKVCSTMKEFTYAENGIKPQLTFVNPKQMETILSIITS